MSRANQGQRVACQIEGGAEASAVAKDINAALAILAAPFERKAA